MGGLMNTGENGMTLAEEKREEAGDGNSIFFFFPWLQGLAFQIASQDRVEIIDNQFWGQ